MSGNIAGLFLLSRRLGVPSLGTAGRGQVICAGSETAHGAAGGFDAPASTRGKLTRRQCECDNGSVLWQSQGSQRLPLPHRTDFSRQRKGGQRATKTLRGVTGFEVISLKGKVENGKITEYRVSLELTFILE
jgi:hypothetical protein